MPHAIPRRLLSCMDTPDDPIPAQGETYNPWSIVNLVFRHLAGLFSRFLDEQLAVGDRLELTGPFVVFTLRDADTEGEPARDQRARLYRDRHDHRPQHISLPT